VALAATLMSAPVARAESNSSSREQEINNDYRGGHVWFGSESVDPHSSETQVLKHAPDAIRWALEHRGVKITEAQLKVSHYTVKHYRVIKVFGKKKTIPLPNTYRGYIAVK
jgi:hypothetical protein